MESSTHNFVVIFNIIYTIITFIIAFGIFYFYKLLQPKYYGLLLFAFFIALIACFFLGLYSETLNMFTKSRANTDEEIIIKEDMIQSLKIIPGIMAAVSANLITEFMLRNAPKP